jgi:pimeloyl-ACP methyl ester carboxylesterase
MGGIVAMRYTIDHPDRVASLVPMDTAAAAAPDDINDNVGFMRTGIEIAGTQGMSALFDTINAAIPDIPELVEFREGLRYDLHAMDPLAFVAFGEELLAYASVLDRLADLRMPATVLVGENDAGLRDAAVAMATTIPDAVLEVIPGAAHSPQIENPAAWLEAVAGHFSRQSER